MQRSGSRGSPNHLTPRDMASSRNPYAGGAAAARGVQTPSSVSSLNTGISQQVVEAKAEKELESERMWWAEASERQVTQLESTFQAEFNRTCSALRAELGAQKDRLEMKVEDERMIRQEGLTELKRVLDEHSVRLAELSAATSSRPSIVGLSSLQTDDLRREMGMLRSDFDAAQLQRGQRDAEVMAASSQLKLQVEAVEAQFTDLARDVLRLQDMLNAKASSLNATAASAAEAAVATASPLMESRIKALELELERLRSESRMAAAASSSSSATLETRTRAMEADLDRLRSETIPLLRNDMDTTQQLATVRAGDESKSSLLIEKLQANLDGVEAQVKELHTNYYSQTASSKVAFQSLDEEMQKASADAAALVGRMNVMEADFMKLHSDTLPLLRSDVDAVSTAGLQKHAESMLRLDRLEAQVKDAHAATLSTSQVPTAEVLRVEGQCSAVSDRLAVLEADVRNLGGNVPGLRSDVDTLLTEKRQQDIVFNGFHTRTEAKLEAIDAQLAKLPQTYIGSEQAQRMVDELHRHLLDESPLAGMRLLESDVQRLKEETAPLSTSLRSVQNDVQRLKEDIAPQLRSDVTTLQDARREKDVEMQTLKTQMMQILSDDSSRGDSASNSTREASQIDAATAASLAARLAFVEGDVSKICRDSVPFLQGEIQRLQTAYGQKDAENSAFMEKTRLQLETVESQIIDVCRDLLGVQDALRMEERLNGVETDMARLNREIFPLIEEVMKVLDSLHAPAATRAPQGLEMRSTTASSNLDLTLPLASAGGSSTSTAGGPAAATYVGPPLLSANLKESIEGLVKKVNDTLSRNREMSSVRTASSATVAAAAEDAATMNNQMATAAGGSGGCGGCGGGSSPITAAGVRSESPSRFLHALEAVRELRQQNLSLRERNAELVEELLTQEGAPPLGTGSSSVAQPLSPSAAMPVSPSAVSAASKGPSMLLGGQPPTVRSPVGAGSAQLPSYSQRGMMYAPNSQPSRSPGPARAQPGPNMTPQLNPNVASAPGQQPLRQASTIRPGTRMGMR